MEKIDCVINVCQKPFQTALNLYSLLKHSAQNIDKKGYKALDNEDIYTLKEEKALKILKNDFNITDNSALHS